MLHCSTKNSRRHRLDGRPDGTDVNLGPVVFHPLPVASRRRLLPERHYGHRMNLHPTGFTT